MGRKGKGRGGFGVFLFLFSVFPFLVFFPFGLTSEVFDVCSIGIAGITSP